MSADVRFRVTVQWRRSGPYAGGTTIYDCGFHRIEGSALVLTKSVDEASRGGYRYDDERVPDYLIIPLDTIGTVIVDSYEVPPGGPR